MLMIYRPDLMNWTCLVYGGPMFFVMIWWFISARKWFKGPRVNVDHLMIGRDGNVIEGDGESSSDNAGDITKPVEAGTDTAKPAALD
jgi:hypothetical protein